MIFLDFDHFTSETFICKLPTSHKHITNMEQAHF